MGETGNAETYSQIIAGNAHPFYVKATPHLPESSGSELFQDTRQQPNDSANRINARRTCLGGSRDNAELSVNIFSRTETRRFPSPYFQFEATEQICQDKKFSALQSLPSTQFYTGHGLDGQTRPQSGLFSLADRSRAPQILKNELQRQTPANDVPTVRPLVSAEDLCIRDELDRGIPTVSQHQMYSVLGRLSPGKPEPSIVTGPHRLCNKPDAETWMENQFRQICSDSDSSTGVLGDHVEYRTEHQVTVGVKVLNATQCTSATDVERQLVPQTGPDPTGETQLCHICSSPRKTALSNNAILQSTVTQKSSTQAVSSTRCRTLRNEVVDRCCLGHHANTQRTDYSPTYNRRFRHRVGRSTSRDNDNRSVDELSTDLARKSERALCSVRSDNTTEPSATQRAYSATNRQSHSSSLHQQRRWNKIQEATEFDERTANAAGHSEHTPVSSVFPRQIQYCSRCSISSKSMSRMASQSRSDRGNFSEVGDTRVGSVCFKNGSCRGEIRVSGRAGRASIVSQRVLPSLGLHPSVGISATEFNTPSTLASKHSSRIIHNNSPEMDQGILAVRSSATSSSSSAPDPGPSASTNRHPDGDTPARNSGNSTRSLADFGWSEIIHDWTDQEKSLLLSSWRKSTLNTYIPVWIKWKAWCSKNSVNFETPSPPEVARYLAYLHNNEGLAYRTILVHKSVIATFTNHTMKVDISSNFFVKHILKAISIAKEKKLKPPIWDPKLVLQYLSDNTPDENNFYQVSRRTAILLMLSSGRRVHDLTLLRADSDGLIDEGDSVVLWPSFGSKTDNANHRQSGWKLLKHPNNNLCAVYWIRRLIFLSAERRKENELLNLFITARGVAKPATRTIIGGWIKSILKEAGVEASPGSVRSAVASLNWLEQFSIDQILATGNWKQEHTFRKFYQRQIIADSYETNNRVSLSSYFNPIN